MRWTLDRGGHGHGHGGDWDWDDGGWNGGCVAVGAARSVGVLTRSQRDVTGVVELY
jgi:hypothetical protein